MKKHDAEKQTKIELLLRTDEVADILYEAIQTSERRNLDWLVDGDSEMHEDTLSDEISKVKTNLREQAYADAAQVNITRCRFRYRSRAASRKWFKVAAASLVALMIIGGGFTESGRAFAQEAYDNPYNAIVGNTLFFVICITIITCLFIIGVKKRVSDVERWDDA